MKIYLVRHGETDWNREAKLQGQKDIPLNEYGRELAERVGEDLAAVPFEAVFSSPLCRAVETAKIITGDRKIPFQTDERLMEVSFGVMEGAKIPEIMADSQSPLYNFYENPGQYNPPEAGETYGELFERGKSFMQEVIKPLEQQFETILVVSHGGLMRSILNPLMGISLDDFWKAEMDNCAVYILSLENGKFSV